MVRPKSLRVDEQGRELLVDLHGRGDFFGTLSLFGRDLRDTSVIAILPANVLQIARDDALRVLERNAKAMTFMFKHQADTIEHQAEMLESIAFLEVPARLARLLLDLRRMAVDLTQDDMAAAVAASRERVNRALADFERRGLVAVERKHVRILDEVGLRGLIRP